MLENLLVQLESNDPTLKKLDLRGQKINFESLQRIAKALEQNTCLEILDLGKNNIDAMGGEVIAKSLEKNNGLKALSIDYNEIGDTGIKAFASILRINTSLIHLDITGNFIGISDRKGPQALAEALIDNSTLKSLKMNVNGIGDDGAQLMAKALEKNTSLEHLYLELNAISEVGEGALTTALEKNTSLTILNLASTVLDPTREMHENCQHCKNRFKYLKRNEKLKEQNLSAIPETASSTINIPTNNNEEISAKTNSNHEPESLGVPQIALNTISSPQPETITVNTVRNGGIETTVEMSFFAPPYAQSISKPYCSIKGYISIEHRAVGSPIDFHISPVLLDGSADQSVLEEQIKNTVLAKKPIVIHFSLASNNTEEIVMEKARKIMREAEESFFSYCDDGLGLTIRTIASPLSFEAFAAKVSSSLTTASPLVAKHEDGLVLKAEKPTHFPWGKLALLLLVLGLGGVIGLSVAGLFFWVTISTVVFLIGAGIGIKALYDTHQQKQRADQKRLLTPDNQKDTSQDVENSYQTRRIKAEQAAAKLTEILKNKGLDFKKAEATINVLGYNNGDFYLTYESLLSVLTVRVELDEEGKAEFQKGWELVEALVIDNPSQRMPPYENCIVIEVDTILNMGLKNNERNSASVTSAQNNAPYTPKFFPEMVKISQANASDIEEVQKANRAKEIIIQKLNEFVSSHQKKKLIINYRNTNFEFTPEEIQECFANMETKLDIVQEQSTGDCMLQWEINTPNDKRRELIEKQFHRVKKQAGEVFSSPATMMGTFDMDRRQSVLVKLAITHCIGENIAVKHPDIRYPNSVLISSQSIEKIIRENPEKNENLILDI